MNRTWNIKAGMVRIAVLVLTLYLAFSTLTACKKTTGKVTSSNGNSSSSDVSSENDGSSQSSSDPGTSSELIDSDGTDSDDSSTGDDNEIAVEDLRIQNTRAPMSNSFMGAGTGIYSCYAYMKDSLNRNDTDKMAQVEFDRLQNMGIKRVRTMFKFTWAWDSTTNTWNWDSDTMKAVYRWMGEMQKRGIDVMLNPWSFEYYIGQGGISDPTNILVTGNYTETCNRFASVVTELFKQMKARGFSNAKYLMMFTEPDKCSAEFDRVSQYDKEYIQIAKAVNSSLTAAGLRKNIQIIGPNQSNEFNTTLLEKCITQANDCFDIFSTHSYIQGQDLVSDIFNDSAIEKWTPYMATMKKTRNTKSFWIDEYNIQDYSWTSKGYSNIGMDEPWRGTQQAVVVAAGMNLGISNMSLWTLSDQLWPDQVNTDLKAGFYSGELRHGLFPTMTTSMIPKAQYYSYSLMSKYFGNGGGKTYYSSSVEEYTGVYISTCNTKEGDWTVMVVNCNYEPVKVNVHFDKALPGVKMFRHRYSPYTVSKTTQASIIDADKTYPGVKKGFSDLIDVGGVTIYTTIKG